MDGGVTNKYTAHNEPPSLFSPLCVAIRIPSAAARVYSVWGSYTRSDTPPERPDLSRGDQKPHFISWPSATPPHHPHPAPLLPLLHLSSLPPAWALLVFFSFSARAPWVIISSRKYNVECQLPLSSLTRPHSANSICPTTTRSAGEIPTSWVNHGRLSSALQAPPIWSY